MPSGRAPAAIAALLALAAAVALVIGLFEGEDRGGGRGPASPSPAETAAEDISPFTGLPGPRGPVLAVKIDNVGPARPQTGLGAADIVYVEQVEAGQSRILAVLSSELPPAVGPVRSARESDLELLRQFGRPALAYSGAQGKLVPVIRAAPLYALSPAQAPDAYSRDARRAAPHNLYLRPDRALAAAPEASTAADIGFRFGDAPTGGKKLAEHTVRYPGARFSFTWSADRDRWLVSMDGTAARTTGGGPLGAATVVVQQVTVRPSEFRDRWGTVSPYTETVGSGAALVLRDGKAYDARWSRPTAQAGTAFTTASGEPLAFARGPVWVVFEAR